MLRSSLTAGGALLATCCLLPWATVAWAAPAPLPRGPAPAGQARPSAAPHPQPPAGQGPTLPPSARPGQAQPSPRPPAQPSPRPSAQASRAPAAQGPQAMGEAQARRALEAIFFQERAEAWAMELEGPRRQPGRQLSPAAWASLALAQAKQGRWQEAEQALRQAPRTGVQGPLARALTAWYRGEWEQAEAQARLALEAGHGVDEVARWALASAQLHRGELEQAQGSLAPLLARPGELPPWLRPWVQVVDAACRAQVAQREPWWRQLQLGPGLKADFEAALALNPRNPNALSALGRFFLLAPAPLGDRAAAVRLLGQADAIDPFFYLNAAHLIQAHLAQGELKEARVEAVRYLARFEGCPVAMLELAPHRAKLGVLPF